MAALHHPLMRRSRRIGGTVPAGALPLRMLRVVLRLRLVPGVIPGRRSLLSVSRGRQEQGCGEGAWQQDDLHAVIPFVDGSALFERAQQVVAEPDQAAGDGSEHDGPAQALREP